MTSRYYLLILVFITFSCGSQTTVIKPTTNSTKKVAKTQKKPSPYYFPKLDDADEGNPQLTRDDYQSGPMPSGLQIPRNDLIKIAKKSGQDIIHWVYDFEEALRLAKLTKRPLLLSIGLPFDQINFKDGKQGYKEHLSMRVPKSPTYMARDYDIHLRMTLFSYKSTQELINRKFIAVRMTFDKKNVDIAEKYGLIAGKFIEPGFAMISPYEEAMDKNIRIVDRIATYNEEYFYHILQCFLDKHPHLNHPSTPTKKTLRLFGNNNKIGIGQLAIANNYLQDGDIEKSKKLCLKLLKNKFFFNGKTRQILGKAHSLEGSHIKALELFTQAYSEAQQHKSLLQDIKMNLIQAQLKSNQLDKAYSSCQRLQKLCDNPEIMAQLLHIMAQVSWLNKNEKQAQDYWEQIFLKHPQTPTAASAALYLMGAGPLIHNMECLQRLPENIFEKHVPSHTHHQQPIPKLNTAIHNALSWLTKYQRSNGAWTDSHYTFMGVEHRHNTYTAISAIASYALNEWQSFNNKAITQTLDLSDSYLMNDKNLSSTRIEKVYAYTFKLMYLCQRLDKVQPTKKEIISDQIKHIINQLAIHQCQKGNHIGAWGHEYYNPFTTANVLQSLAVAKGKGFIVPDDMINSALVILKKFRGQEGGFPYAYGNKPGKFPDDYTRSPYCEYALWSHNTASDQYHMIESIERFFKNVNRLNAVRQYDFHAGKYNEGGFFYYYDLYGLSLAIKNLSNGRMRAKYSFRLLDIMLKNQEIDGSFVDSPNVGKSYGTGMALLILKNIYDEVINI